MSPPAGDQCAGQHNVLVSGQTDRVDRPTGSHGQVDRSFQLKESQVVDIGSGLVERIYHYIPDPETEPIGRRREGLCAGYDTKSSD